MYCTCRLIVNCQILATTWGPDFWPWDASSIAHATEMNICLWKILLQMHGAWQSVLDQMRHFCAILWALDYHDTVVVYRLTTQNLGFIAPMPEQIGIITMRFSNVGLLTPQRNALYGCSFVLAWVQRISFLRPLQISADRLCDVAVPCT